MGETSESPVRPAIPPPQRNYQVAAEKALTSVRVQTAEQLIWLGAVGTGSVWRLPVLAAWVTVDVDTGRVWADDTGDVGRWWRILILHYLAVSHRPPSRSPEICFADLPGGMAYSPVYQQRVISRLCNTVGRTAETLAAAAEVLGARRVDAGDLAFDLVVFPRLTVRLIWHAGDEEFQPTATLLLPGNVEALFCIEDIVVLSESVVSRLSGRAF